MDQQTQKSSKIIWLFVIILFFILIGGGLWFLQSLKNSKINNGLSELDRVAGAMIEIECYYAAQPLRQPEDIGTELETKLMPRTQDKTAINNIIKKYGFANEAEFNKVGQKYKGLNKLTQKTIGSEQYKKCMEEATGFIKFNAVQ